MITIAIATFNSLPYTQLFFRFLRGNARIPYHLIVVDNNSTDGTREWLQEQKGVELVLNKRNLGFAQANNQAFTRCKTSFFLGLNNDTAVFPGFLEKLLQIMEVNPEYGELGIHSNCLGAQDPRIGKKVSIEKPGYEDLSWKKLERKMSEYYGDYEKFFNSFFRRIHHHMGFDRIGGRS